MSIKHDGACALQGALEKIGGKWNLDAEGEV